MTEVRLERRGRALSVLLDRPKALNALTLPMIEAIEPALRAAAVDPAIEHVVIRGAGSRAFCAGGDVRAVALSIGQSGATLWSDFFRDEYRLNRRIHRYPKPFTALIEGISMGGGVGLSMHGRFRVAAETLVFAMPETGIGFFPDIGGGWFLNRFPGAVGRFLALTGARLGAADARAIGYATHIVPAERLDALAERLADATAAEVPGVLDAAAIDPGPAPLDEHRAAIDRCFGQPTVEAVLAALAAEGTPWAAGWLEQLAAKSPTSLKVSLAQLDRSRGLEIEAVLALEYRMSQHFMAAPDFREGIRALLIDKDNRPHWQPSELAAVTPAQVAAYFAPLPGGDLTFPD